MGYITNNLLKNETVLHQTYLHWAMLLRSLVWLLGAYYLGYNVKFIPGAAIFIVIASFSLLGALIARYTSEYAVTNRRVLAKTGFIRRNAIEILLSQIAAVEIRQNVLGRWFGYGTIIIHSTGGAFEPLRMLCDPITFRRAIQDQMKT